MFSALKKLTNRNATDGNAGAAAGGVQSMAASLQRRFARGVQYNSKLFPYLALRKEFLFGCQCLNANYAIIY